LSAARPFVARTDELAALRGAVRRAIEGQGDLILLAGEAGVGKTRCAREALNGGSLQLIEAFAFPPITPPYGPLISILCWALGRDPLAVAGWGPLANHLAGILPELATLPPRSDQPTLVAAIQDALTVMANGAPTAILLDDLQWADSATLDLLVSMAGWA
jgi:predicted ATPase